MEPKTPEEVYKTWLESAGSALRPSLLAEHPVDSARQNLSATFVNAFVNAGFGKDKLVTTEDGNKWMYKNKDHGMFFCILLCCLFKFYITTCMKISFNETRFSKKLLASSSRLLLDLN